MELLAAETARLGVAGSIVAVVIVLALVWLVHKVTRRFVNWPVVFGVLALVVVFAVFSPGSLSGGAG